MLQAEAANQLLYQHVVPSMHVVPAKHTYGGAEVLRGSHVHQSCAWKMLDL